MNVYFPTDPLTVNFDDEELQQVLRDIDKIMDEAEYDDVNRKNSGFSEILRAFSSRIGLSSVWGKLPVSYTHIHTDLKSTSILDNFLVNERLLELIEDAGVFHFTILQGILQFC